MAVSTVLVCAPALLNDKVLGRLLGLGASFAGVLVRMGLAAGMVFAVVLGVTAGDVGVAALAFTGEEVAA